MTDQRAFIRKLELPYESMRTIYEGDSEVRLYRNELTDELQVGKRFDILGVESAVAVKEGALLRQIDHRNITPVFDVVRVTDFPKPMQVVEIIMPYYERGSLYDSFKTGQRFSISAAINGVIGALHGLSELHDVRGILHRDIKSPNLLIDGDGRFRVSDLGVAVEMSQGGGAEALPQARLYSPPESLTTQRVDRRSDLYQLGMVLHELVSGPLPYGDPSFRIEAVARRLEQGRRGVPPRFLQHAPWVPPRLRTVINKALAEDPSARYLHAKAMVDALAAIPYVDWQLVVDESEFKRWEGSTVHAPDRRFAVTAKFLPPKQGRKRVGWRLSGYQQITVPRKILPDELVNELAQAASFFDKIVVIATRR